MTRALTLTMTVIAALLIGCAAPTETAQPIAETTLTEPPEPSATPSPTAVPPTETPTPTATPVPSPTLTPSITPIPERITTTLDVEMILIPEGEFIQGAEDEWPDESPQRTVYLDAFYIDRTEVPNKHYQACVEAGFCEPPRRTDCCTEEPGGYVAWPDYFGNPEFDDHPVIFISWYDARDFCEWRGARLPTEAEWEKASRGPDGRMYPWGNEDPTPELLNYTWPPGAFDGQRPLYVTAPVESYEAGASPYGVLNLAGNVYEWVLDIYDADYYSYAPDVNPQGPEDDAGTFRVTRGGSFFNQAYRNRSSNRNNAYIPADSVHFDGGARCAMDVAVGE